MTYSAKDNLLYLTVLLSSVLFLVSQITGCSYASQPRLGSLPEMEIWADFPGPALSDAELDQIQGGYIADRDLVLMHFNSFLRTTTLRLADSLDRPSGISDAAVTSAQAAALSSSLASIVSKPTVSFISTATGESIPTGVTLLPVSPVTQVAAASPVEPTAPSVTQPAPSPAPQEPDQPSPVGGLVRDVLGLVVELVGLGVSSEQQPTGTTTSTQAGAPSPTQLPPSKQSPPSSNLIPRLLGIILGIIR